MTTLAESYRPRLFAEVLGQDGARWVLQSLVAHANAGSRFPSSVLLAGPSGTGKTSLARIVARALNCEQAATGEPCLTCPSCLQSLDGTHPAVLEPGNGFASADAARELIAATAVAHPFRHLVVILDEAHAMSRQAWDVMLRTMEADPPGVTFIFCTVSPERLRAEVLSRVYRFDLAPPSDSLVALRLRQAAAAYERELPEQAAFDLADRAGGNVRTALQLLEKVLLHPELDVVAVLGRSGFGLDLAEAAVRRDRTRGILLLDEAWTRMSASEIYEDWMRALELLLLAKYEGTPTENPALLERLRGIAPAYHETMLAAGMEVVAEWARRGGRRGTLGHAWAAYLKAINGPTAVDVTAARKQPRKVTTADLSDFTL